MTNSKKIDTEMTEIDINHFVRLFGAIRHDGIGGYMTCDAAFVVRESHLKIAWGLLFWLFSARF